MALHVLGVCGVLPGTLHMVVSVRAQKLQREENEDEETLDPEDYLQIIDALETPKFQYASSCAVFACSPRHETGSEHECLRLVWLCRYDNVRRTFAEVPPKRSLYATAADKEPNHLS